MIIKVRSQTHEGAVITVHVYLNRGELSWGTAERVEGDASEFIAGALGGFQNWKVERPFYQGPQLISTPEIICDGCPYCGKDCSSQIIREVLAERKRCHRAVDALLRDALDALHEDEAPNVCAFIRDFLKEASDA